MIAAFEQELEQNYQEYLQKRAEALAGTYFSSRVKTFVISTPPC